MNPLFASKIKLLGELCLITAVAGIVYQMLSDGMVNHLAIIMGASLGFAYGIIELFLLKGLRKKLVRFPLFPTILIKSIIYLTAIFFVTNALGLIVGFSQGKQWEDFTASLASKDQVILVAYTLMIFILLSFYIQMNLLLGEGVFLKFLSGKYRKPVEENRIFMFLDLKSSTTIAEQLGLEKYYSLLNDFFHEISEPVLFTNAEIYQYVGDEVIFTWKTNRGVKDSNCLKIFFKIREKVHSNRKYYREKYGVVPDFKAGLHFGKVISAQIGDLKREITYNGDVLNTSARIQEQCNKFERELLISGKLLGELNIENEYKAERLETIRLRGKQSDIELFSLAQF